MPIQITFELSLEDFRAAQLLHLRRSFWQRLMRLLTHLIFPICGAGFLILALTVIGKPGSLNFFLTLTVCGLYLTCLPLYLNWRLKSAYKRTRSGKSVCTATFTEEQVNLDAGNMKSEVEWSAIQSVREDKSLFMLYIAQAKFIAIPKRACTEAQVDELRALFARNIAPLTRTGAEVRREG